jgi:class 3 adenylate cyclase/RecA/RadA recombinase
MPKRREQRLSGRKGGRPAGPRPRPLPTDNVTFLFTDIEGSTTLWDEHPAAMGRALGRHDAILREAVLSLGHIVKTTGDGLVAAFAETADAVVAARAAQERLAEEDWGEVGTLRVRMGLHAGEAERRDDDYYGPAVNLTSRLMAVAHGGQVVLSEACAERVRDVLPAGMGLLDLGEHQLRGLARPEHVYQLTIPNLPSQFPALASLAAFPSGVPLALPLFARTTGELAGRHRELQALEAAWRQASAGVFRVALVAGEPGIGKTRLAAELSERAHAEGGAVLYGRCDEEAVAPYQPFVEALRPYLAACPPSTLHERLHGLERDLARVFPQLTGLIPELPSPVVSRPESAILGGLEDSRDADRYRLFEAVGMLLTGITATQPAVLVLDDVHWADKPTLLLLRHVVRSASDAALLIVACYRDVELLRGQPVTDLLGDLRREAFVTRLALVGLSEAESAEMVRGLAGSGVSSRLAAPLHRETAGNPFFLEEMLRHLAETNSMPGSDLAGSQVDLGSLDTPEGVRDLVGRRLRRLPGSVTELLSVAAVIGADFDTELLSRAAQVPVEVVLDSLDRATEAGLVTPHPSRLGRFSFSHALIRQTLYAGLGTARRAQLHAHVGAAIEALAGPAQAAATLAQHFTQAVALGQPQKAIDYNTEAGHQAVADLAFEDAVTYFECALGLLTDRAPADTRRRAPLLTDLAQARVYVDEASGVETAREAVDAARANGSPEELARAVVVLAEPAFSATRYPAEVSRLLDEASAALGDSHVALRARLLALAAFKYATYQLQGRDGRMLAEEALALAHQCGDRLTLADALLARAVSLEGSVTPVAERIALGEELTALGGGVDARPWSYGLRVLASAYLEMGDADGLAKTIAVLGRIGHELRWLPALVYSAQWHATQAMLEGRFANVHALGAEMRRHARAYRGAVGMYTVQAFYLNREQGGPTEVAALKRIADERPGNMYVRAMLAISQLDSGDQPAAVAGLEALAADGFGAGERESAWSAILALLAEVAATSGARPAARVLYELLLPFADRLLTAATGLACLGSADRYLGMLSTLLERWPEAERHFDRAVELEARIHGRALTPRTRYWHARFLLARRAPGDDGAARHTLREVVEQTTTLGMRRLRAQAEALVEV